MNKFPEIFVHIKQDRNKRNNFTEKLTNIFAANNKISAILDFCAWDKGDIDASLKSVDVKKLTRYIYISTDSVYEVCGTIPSNFKKGI